MAEEVQAKIDAMDIPPDVNVQMGGAVEDLQDSMRDLMLLLTAQSDPYLPGDGQSVRIHENALYHYVFHSLCIHRGDPGPPGYRNHHECDLHGRRCDAGWESW